MQGVKSIMNFVISLTVPVLLCLPALDDMAHIDSASPPIENRQFAQSPKWDGYMDSLLEIPGKYDKFYNDHMGFRKSLVYLNSISRLKYLGVSPSTKVLVGRDGWLYYRDEDVIDDFMGRLRFTDEDLMDYRLDLEGKRAWLAERGIKYIFVVAPSQSTVYPEYLPEAFASQRGASMMDQLSGYMKQNSDFQILDLRAPILAQKDRHPLYFKQGSHWNDYGAYIAYNEILTAGGRYFPELRPRQMSDFTTEPYANKKDTQTVWFRGDVGYYDAGNLWLLAISDNPFGNREDPCFVPRVKNTAVDVKLDRSALASWQTRKESERPFAKETKNSRLRALVYHDSFSRWLVPFMSEHFGRSVYLWQRADYYNLNEWVEREHPDIVIEVVCERFLSAIPNPNPDFAAAIERAHKKP